MVWYCKNADPGVVNKHADPAPKKIEYVSHRVGETLEPESIPCRTHPLIIEERIKHWASERAAIFASSSKADSALEEQINTLDSSLKDWIAENLGDQADQLSLRALQYRAQEEFLAASERINKQGEEALTAAEHRLAEISEAIGKSRGRGERWKHTASLEKERDMLLDQVSIEVDRFLRAEPVSDPDNKPAEIKLQAADQALELAMAAEEHGKRDYLRAEICASNIFSMLGNPIGNANQILDTLDTFKGEDRHLLLSVYRERYGQDLLDKLEASYFNKITRLKNTLKIPKIRKAMKERWGIEVGLLNMISHEVKQFFAKGSASQKAEKEAGSSDNREQTDDRMRVEVPQFFGSPVISRAQALERHDKLTAITDRIFYALWNERYPISAISDELVKIDKPETEKMEQDFRERYSQFFGGRSLREVIRKRFDSLDERNYLEARLNAEDYKADGILFHMKLGDQERSRRTPAVIEMLGQLSQINPVDLQHFKNEYQKMFDPLDRDTLNDLLSVESPGRLKRLFRFALGIKPAPTEPELLDWACFLFEGDAIGAQAARSRCILTGVSKEWPGIVFYDTPREYDQKIIDRYEELYKRSYWKDFRKNRGRERTQIMRAYIENGELTLAQQVRHCLAGWGADSKGLRACLADKTPKEMERLNEDYAREFQTISLWPSQLWDALKIACGKQEPAFNNPLTGNPSSSFMGRFCAGLLVPRNLEKDLDWELSGDKRMDVARLMEGAVDTPENQMQQLYKRYKDEHGGWDFISEEEEFRNLGPLARRLYKPILLLLKLIKKVKKPKPDLVRKEKDIKTVEKFYHAHIAGKDHSDEELDQFRQLLKIAHHSLDVARQIRKDTAETITNIGAIGLVIFAAQKSLVMGSPLVPTMVAVGAFSILLRLDIKSTILGKIYGRHTAEKDSFLGGIDGVTVSATNAVKSFRLLRSSKMLRAARASGHSTKFLRFIRYLRYGRSAASAGVKMTLKKKFKVVGERKITAALLEDMCSGHFQSTEGSADQSYHQSQGRNLIKSLRNQQGTSERLDSSLKDLDKIFEQAA